jgi:hypothetical protein
MKMQCVGAWRGLGAKPAQLGLLHESVCPAPAQRDDSGPACNFTGNIQEAQNRSFKPILIAEYKLLCRSRPSLKQNIKPDGDLALTVSLRLAPLGKRDSAAVGMITATGGCPSRNAARNLDAQFLDSEAVMKEKIKIARVAGRLGLGPTSAGSGCQITRGRQQLAVLSPVLQSNPYFHPKRIGNHML